MTDNKITDKWFCYSYNEGFRLYDTEQEAIDAANSIIDLYRKSAYPDGWDKNVEKVCCGLLYIIENERFGLVSMSARPVKFEEEWYYDCSDDYVDYKLEALQK